MHDLTAIYLFDLRHLLYDWLHFLLSNALLSLLFSSNLGPYWVFWESFLVHLDDGMLLFHLSEDRGSASYHL